MNKVYLLILSSFITIISLFLIKDYIINKNFVNIILSALLYLSLIYVYIKLFEDGEISSLYVILQIIQILVVSIIGIAIYREQLTYNKMIGIFAGITSVYFLS